MLLEVNFRVKKYRESWSNQEIRTVVKSVEVAIKIEGVECCGSFSGKTDETVWEVFYAVWEVLALYDGYFYEPLFASVDKASYDIEKIYGMKFRKTDKSWTDVATLLGQGDRKIDEDIILEYMDFRSQGRQQGKMTKSLINAYFYLLSVAYKEINIEHKLSLMLNVCDGYFLNEIGKSSGTGGHIVNLIGNINKEKVQYGLQLMGIPKGKITELFGGVRDEIDHYIIKQFSAGSYVPNLIEAAGRSLNLYLLYIAELSVRVTFLERIHGSINPKAKERAIDSINDWFILECDFSDKCKLPENQMEQEFRKVCSSIS
ncbi:hypothetical protein AALB64_00215 [Lachnospiraceae bacterium 45-P1]